VLRATYGAAGVVHLEIELTPALLTNVPDHTFLHAQPGGRLDGPQSRSLLLASFRILDAVSGWSLNRSE
jgi:hypothetical protein